MSYTFSQQIRPTFCSQQERTKEGSKGGKKGGDEETGTQRTRKKIAEEKQPYNIWTDDGGISKGEVWGAVVALFVIVAFHTLLTTLGPYSRRLDQILAVSINILLFVVVQMFAFLLSEVQLFMMSSLFS